MDNITIIATTLNNCNKIRSKFEKLKIKADFKYDNKINCITPLNWYMHQECTITTNKKYISKEGNAYIKNLHVRSKIIIN
jgi:hypothetical protein